MRFFVLTILLLSFLGLTKDISAKPKEARISVTSRCKNKINDLLRYHPLNEDILPNLK